MSKRNMSKHNIDIRIISLQKKFSTIGLQSIFPNSKVQIQRGVDIRKANLKNIYKANIIGQAGYNSINQGRRRHSELNSKGGIGLGLANRFAISQHVELPLLLLEDDFKIKNTQKFVNEIDILNMHMDLFDLAVFGVNYRGSFENLEPVHFMPEGWYHLSLGEKFWNTHCVFYSPEGRRKVSSFFINEPMDMQIDGLYAFWAETRELRIILQVKKPTVVQKFHASSIQTDFCYMCDLLDNENMLSFNKTSVMKVIFVSVVLLVLYICIRRFRS